MQLDISKCNALFIGRQTFPNLTDDYLFGAEDVNVNASDEKIILASQYGDYFITKKDTKKANG